MTTEEVKAFYGTGYKFQKSTGMSANSFENWMKRGFVPTFSQLKIERATNGKLKAVWD